MSDKSGTSAGVISLPQGGGTLQGIGETFSPDHFTGAGNLAVPIAVPPGRKGFQPEPNLVYSTGNGHTPFGLGWAFSIPGISSKTSQGIPRYDNSKGVFVLSGADLFPEGNLYWHQTSWRLDCPSVAPSAKWTCQLTRIGEE